MYSENTWYNLDNQAIIYPAVSDKRNTNVFRLSCELTESIIPKVLQNVAEQTLNDFPYYKMILRRGLFWFYLESSQQEIVVEKEATRPCGEIFHVQKKDYLFKISYYKTRINLEVFHALADGGGAIEFLKSLVYNYLVEVKKTQLPSPMPVMERKAHPVSQAEDAFLKHYAKGGDKTLEKKSKAYTIGGSMLPYNDVRVLSASFLSKELITLAREKEVSITSYITALFMCAIYEEMMPNRFRKKDISITTPVDLRRMFPSATFRNFFTVVDIRYNFADLPTDFDSVLMSVDKQLKEKTQKDQLEKAINYNMAAQKNIVARAVPLIIKNFVLKAIYKYREKESTTTITNLGVISMPDELSPYINNFQALINPTSTHRIKMAITSYKDTMVVNFTSRIEETSIEKFFIRHLANNGVNITLTTN